MSDDRWEKDRELALRFLKLLGHGDAIVERPGGPHPDVIWSGPHGTIGLEITRVVSDQALVEREALRERALERARVLVHTMGIDELAVYVHWHQDAPTPGQSIVRLAEELAAIIRAHLPKLGQTTTLGTDLDFDQEFDHATFDRITIDRSILHGGNDFYSGYFAWGRDMTAGHLAERISSKSAKDRTGMPPLAEHWLVLYGGHGPLSSYMEPLPPALLVTYPSVFQRIFLTFLSQERVWEIPTSPLELGA